MRGNTMKLYVASPEGDGDKSVTIDLNEFQSFSWKTKVQAGNINITIYKSTRRKEKRNSHILLQLS